MGLYREQGIVLRTYKLGEADRIVVLLGAGRGKVRAVAKGVRKTKSRFGGRLEPLSHVSLLLYEGRQLDTITQAESIEHYRPLHEDLGRMTDAMALLEVVDQVAQEGEANVALYKMLQGALRTLCTEAPSPLLVAGFYWKLLALEGVAPAVEMCVSCGAEACAGADLVALDPAEGGALCSACCPAPGSREVSAETLRVIGRILAGDLRSVLSDPRSETTVAVTDRATTWMEQHLERRLRTVRMMHLT